MNEQALLVPPSEARDAPHALPARALAYHVPVIIAAGGWLLYGTAAVRGGRVVHIMGTDTRVRM